MSAENEKIETKAESPLTEHLEELRKRLMLCVSVFLICSIAVYFAVPQIVEFLKAPAGPALGRLVFFGPAEGIINYIKIDMVASLIICSPLLVYELWLFVCPALYSDERKHGVGLAFFGFILFIIGGSFAYYVLLPFALKFLLNFASAQFQPLISISSYFSFVLGMVLVCGGIFEMPIIAWFLTKINVITPAFLRKNRKYAIVIILITAAIVTPTPDAFNMLMVALPMFVLYEVSIWISTMAMSAKKEQAVLDPGQE